jgi:hypothetical protein
LVKIWIRLRLGVTNKNWQDKDELLATIFEFIKLIESKVIHPRYKRIGED